MGATRIDFGGTHSSRESRGRCASENIDAPHGGNFVWDALCEGQKYYKCDNCGKSFTLSSSLKQHIKSVHEGRKDHKCAYCEKSFARSTYLRNHIKVFHSESEIGPSSLMNSPSVSKKDRFIYSKEIVTLYGTSKNVTKTKISNQQI